MDVAQERHASQSSHTQIPDLANKYFFNFETVNGGVSHRLSIVRVVLVRRRTCRRKRAAGS